MTDPHLHRAIQDLTDSRDDLHLADSSSAKPALERFLRVLESEPLWRSLGGLLPTFDYAHWRKAASAKRELAWPVDLAERVACRISLCREGVTAQHGFLEFMYEFRTVSGNLDDRWTEWIGLIVDPLMRDLSRLLERRPLPPILDRVVANRIASTGDQELDALLGQALERFASQSADDRKVALEGLWDAWERLKTIRAPNKIAGMELLIGVVSAEPRIQQLLNDEARALTSIGNTLHIRHFERDTTPIKNAAVVDYLFYRMFTLIWLFLGSPPAGQGRHS